MSSIPNDWHDATPAAQWRLNTEYETASIEFTTPHGKVWWNGSLKSDKSRDYCREQLKKVGWNGDPANYDLSPTPVRILVGLNDKNPDKQEVKAISAKGSGAAKPPKDPVKARSLMSKLAGADAPATSPSDPFAGAPEPGSDDIPF
jgi:hypothetical protein